MSHETRLAVGSSLNGRWRPFLAVLFLAAFGWPGEQSACGADKVTKPTSLPPAKMLAEDEKNFIDDADAEVDVDASFLVIPTRLLSKYPRESERVKFQQELRALLVEGFQDKAAAVESAKRHCETARRSIPDDPRPHYALGLVLLDHHKAIMAIEEFQASLKTHKLPIFPAQQGIAWIYISRGNFGQGLPAALDLAKRLVSADAAWPDAEDREHTAEWLGRLIGFLEGPAKTAEQAAAIQTLATNVGKVLKEDLQQAYERGRRQVSDRYAELSETAAALASNPQSELSRQRDAILTAAAAADTEVKQLEEDLLRLQEPHEKLLADLHREIHAKTQLIEITTAKLPGAEAAVESHATPKKHAQMKGQGMSRRPTKPIVRDENAGEKKIRESELASAQKALDRLQATIDDSRDEIATARTKRAKAQQEYRQASAEIRTALHAARYKALELSALAQQAERGKLTVEVLQARSKSIDTYVPFAPVLEQARVLASLKTVTR